MFICEEEILDASYDDTLLCDSVITDGAVVILQKMPVTVSLTDQDTSFQLSRRDSMTLKLSRRDGMTVLGNKYCYQTSHFYVNHIKVRISVIITQTVVLFLAKIRT